MILVKSSDFRILLVGNRTFFKEIFFFRIWDFSAILYFFFTLNMCISACIVVFPFLGVSKICFNPYSKLLPKFNFFRILVLFKFFINLFPLHYYTFGIFLNLEYFSIHFFYFFSQAFKPHYSFSTFLNFRYFSYHFVLSQAFQILVKIRYKLYLLNNRISEKGRISKNNRHFFRFV